MSALADDPDHFIRWFAARAGGGEEDFAPRMLYGDYLAELLAGAGIAAVRGEAVDLADGVVLADGGRIDADVVVLAPGNLKPATPPGIDPEALGPLWIDDPWAEGIADGLGAGDIVLLLGTGLTAVDAALTLEAAGFAGPDRRFVAARPRAPGARPARADGGALRGIAAGLHGDAAPGAGAERRDRLAQRRPRIAHRHPEAVGRGGARRSGGVS